MEINIRKATINDLPQLAVLFNLYRIFYGKESDQDAAEKFLSERITKLESEILLAETGDNHLAGFTQLYPLFSSTRMQRLWLLNDLFVPEPYRGKGISKKLIEAAKNIAIDTNAAGLLLETAKTNAVGNKLYPAAGFKLEQKSNFYFWENNF